MYINKQILYIKMLFSFHFMNIVIVQPRAQRANFIYWQLGIIHGSQPTAQMSLSVHIIAIVLGQKRKQMRFTWLYECCAYLKI